MKAESKNEDGFECPAANTISNHVGNSPRIENQPTFLSQESVFQVDTNPVLPPPHNIIRSSSSLSLDHYKIKRALSKSTSSSESINRIPTIRRTESQPVIKIQTSVMPKSRQASLSSVSQNESNSQEKKRSESTSSVRDRKRSESERSTVSSYISAQCPRTHSVGGISRAKIKTIKLTITVICCYIICSLPFIAAELWSVFDPLAYETAFFTGPTYTILTLLASLNSCANPYIFLAFNPNLLQNCVDGISIALHLKSGYPRGIPNMVNFNANEKRGERGIGTKSKGNCISNPNPLRKNLLSDRNVPEIVTEERGATQRPHRRQQHNSHTIFRFRGGLLADVSERNESTSSAVMVEIDASALKRVGQCITEDTIAKASALN